jgi:hypothetical protein
MPKMKPPDYPKPTFTGPFGNLVRLLGDTGPARYLENTLRTAFASDVLPPRTLALMFSVVARTLNCQLCESYAAELTDAYGVPREVREETLATLSSPGLTELEALILPWTRDTVWMPEQPAQIQKRSRPIVEAIGPRMFLEVVGGAAIANGCVRLAMLET